MLLRLKNLEERLKSTYESIKVNDENCFLKKTGEIFRLFGMKNFNAICVEYATNIKEAEKNLYEDGDLFYMDELNEEDMLKAIINEIEDE